MRCAQHALRLKMVPVLSYSTLLCVGRQIEPRQAVLIQDGPPDREIAERETDAPAALATHPEAVAHREDGVWLEHFPTQAAVSNGSNDGSSSAASPVEEAACDESARICP